MNLLKKFKIKDKRYLWGLGALGLLLIVVLIWSIANAISVPYDVNDPEVQAKLTRIQELRQEIRAQKNVIGNYITIGHIYQDLGDPKRELNAYKTLARIRPQSSPPFIAMGQYWVRPEHKDPLQAERNMLKAINNDPGNVSIYQDLSFLYIYDLPNREEKFEALVLDGANQHPTVKANLIHTLAFYFKEVGNKAKAIEYFNQLIEVAPDKASLWRDNIAELE